MFKKIKAIIVEQLGVIDPSEVTLESAFDSMDIDSIDAVDIIMAIEDEFEISIPDETAESFNSIQDILNYLKSIDLGGE
jgi:acyl carrier protein